MTKEPALGDSHDAPSWHGLDTSVDPAFHPLPTLLSMSADDIHSFYRRSQRSDFMTAFSRLKQEGGSLISAVKILDQYDAAYSSVSLRQRLDIDTLECLFYEMHEHVMAHPVWTHPFFVRFAQEGVARNQLEFFARQYYNQVKNTRQCVALALGRFHTFLNRPDGNLNNVLAELTQVVLAGLLADEYGVGTQQQRNSHSWIETKDDVGTVDISRLFTPLTHAALYRRFLQALGVSVSSYDVPMLHGVADNALVQRILASDPAYDHLEALASVGLGMEWGVPSFFSMIISGILKYAQREDRSFSPAEMEIWSAHVHQDVAHAIAVMTVTSFYVCGKQDVIRIKGATNALMAFRYEMMSDLYETVFGESCARVDSINLEKRYLLCDRRLEQPLLDARCQVRRTAVREYESYVRQRSLPKIFLES